MTKEQLKILNDKFALIVTSIINSNARFYGIEETIKWCFVPSGIPSILATCDRQTNIVSINIESFKDYYDRGNLIEAEYFIVHEIRHIFQHIQIRKYKANKQCDVDPTLVSKRIYEAEHYEQALDKDGKENPKYFLQDSEFDAYAFSYAVVKYKYGDINVYKPENYGQEFYDLFYVWIIVFIDNEL